MLPELVQIGAESGEFPGGSFNALVRAFHARQQQRPARPPTREPSGPALIVSVKNASGSDRLPGQPLGLKGPITPYATDGNQVYQRPTVEGVTPTTAHSDKFVVCTAKIANGGVGPAVLLGATWAKVFVNNETHTHAKIKDATATYLESGTDGVPIVWKEAGTGEKWALILLGGGGGSGSAFTQRAIVTEAAGASTHIASGIQFGTIGKCRLLGPDGGTLLGDECDFKSVHRVQIPVGVIINLSSPDTIRPGTVWETSGTTPVSRIVGEFTEVTDYLHELAGNGQMKSLAIGEGGSAATDIKWLGKTCTT